MAPDWPQMDDLLLDPQIRAWVIVPILLITFLVGIGALFNALSCA